MVRSMSSERLMEGAIRDFVSALSRLGLSEEDAFDSTEFVKPYHVISLYGSSTLPGAGVPCGVVEFDRRQVFGSQQQATRNPI